MRSRRAATQRFCLGSLSLFQLFLASNTTVIVDPNESEPDCGLVDSSDSDDDDDMLQGPGRHRARANGIDDDHDHDLADDDDRNIIIPYDSDSDYSP